MHEISASHWGLHEVPQPPEGHVYFTASATSYLRSLGDEDRRAEAFAVHYQDAPQKVEDGTRFSMILPMLLVTGYFQQPHRIARRITAILNRHWHEEFTNG